MGYNLKSLTSELVNKNLADGGLVAWGQASGGGFLWSYGCSSSVNAYHLNEGWEYFGNSIYKQADKIFGGKYYQEIKNKNC